ncbi:hypothetical protein [Lacticaseibacillus suihuaensis]
MSKRLLVVLETIVLIFGGGLLRLVFEPFMNWRLALALAYGLWAVLLWLVSSRVAANRRQALTKLWQLADRLGYSAADLSRRTPRYGAVDWQLSRPENLQFYPADATVARLTRELTAALAQREA